MKFENLFDLFIVPYLYSMDKSSQSDFVIVNVHITFLTIISIAAFTEIFYIPLHPKNFI